MEHADKMVSRLGPPQGASGFPPAHVNHYPADQVQTARLAPPRSAAPEFRIEIRSAADPEVLLLVLREEAGYLVIEGDESRWPEATMRFLQQMRQWSGQTGLRWQDEVERAAGN